MDSALSSNRLSEQNTSNPNQGSALLAISGALIWPGVGHFLVGSYYLGLFWFSTAIGLVLGIFGIIATAVHVPWLGILVSAALLLEIVQIFDAIRCARRGNGGFIPEPVVRFAAAALLTVAAIFLQHQVISYLQDNVFEICYTPTPSMAPLLVAGDRFVTLKSMPINRWDIVGFNCPEDLLATAGVAGSHWMKRVVGLPGEKVEVTGKGVFINDAQIDIPAEAGPYLAVDNTGQPLAGPSPSAANGCWGRPIKLAPDEYFLLGDNTLDSLDSRFWPSVSGRQPGAMPREEITCRVVGICWPPSRWRMFP